MFPCNWPQVNYIAMVSQAVWPLQLTSFPVNKIMYTVKIVGVITNYNNYVSLFILYIKKDISYIPIVVTQTWANCINVII